MAIRIRTRAELDLIEIDETVSQDNPIAADKLIGDIVARFSALEAMPRMGTSRSDVVAGLRMFPVPGYLIFYIATPDGIEIVRVINGARDYRRLF